MTGGIVAHQPGRLLAAGRDADIFEYGAHSVLRRSRAGRSMALEAMTMDYLAGHGYPVPAVEELSDDSRDLVMQRIVGRSMVEQLGRAPWTVRRQADTLAMLHLRLHEIPPADFLPPAPFGQGSSVLHLDLHPLNVLISDAGPVVIDWTSACVGSPDADVALAWLLMSAGEIPGGRVRARLLGLGRDLVTNRFFARFDPDALLPQLPNVAAWKAADANLAPEEVASLWRAVRRVEADARSFQ